MTEGWRLDEYRDRATHGVISIEIMPEGDSSAHVSDEFCACGPRVETPANGVPMLIHNSFDGREKFENLRDQ